MQLPSAPLRLLRCCVLTLAFVLTAASAHAQTACLEEDAGMCSDDAGTEAHDDAGSEPGPIFSTDGGTDGASIACSCESDLASDGDRIHLCTQSFELDVCLDLECERGTERRRACPTTDATHCCEMPARGLYTALYSDCTHPNCESGFNAQCEDFGGTVVEGACPSTPPRDFDESDDDGGGMCSVSGAGLRGSALPAVGLLLLAGLLRARRRRSA